MSGRAWIRAGAARRRAVPFLAVLCLAVLFLGTATGCASETDDPTDAQPTTTEATTATSATAPASSAPASTEPPDSVPPDSVDGEEHDDHGQTAPIPDSPATFSVDPPSAFLTGLVDGSTAPAIATLVEDHPDVDTIVFTSAGGDPSLPHGIEAGRVLRDAGLHTHIVPGSALEGPAVDLFLAGNRRTVSAEVEFRVGSWTTPEGEDAAGLPRDHPAHAPYLAYYDEVGIDPAFYWFRLQAAPAGSFHTMVPEEVERFILVAPQD